MFKRLRESFRRLLLWSISAGVAIATYAHSDDLSYQSRGNRYEGSRTIDVAAPTFESLSFVRGAPLAAQEAPASLGFWFYLPAEAAVRIRALELIPIAHYEMRPIRTSWSRGWNNFSPWETRAVISPLNISLSNIGVLAQVGSTDSSDELAPVEFTDPTKLKSAPSYSFTFRTKYDLKSISYRVISPDTRANIVTGNLSSVAGGAPATVEFSLKGNPVGRYQLSLDCLYDGRPGGPQRTFAFYHAE